MKFEQKADFEIIPKDKATARLNNDAPIAFKQNGKDVSEAELIKIFGKDSVLKLENIFTIEQIRDGKVVHTETISNAVTNAAINDILDTYFGGTAKKAGFFLGLIDSTGYTATAVTDTMASHAGWVEFATYDEVVRQSWTPGAASAQEITGSAVSEFTIGTVASQTIHGLFVTDTNTKSGTAGFLWSTALFSAAAPVITADVFRVTYTLRLGN